MDDRREDILAAAGEVAAERGIAAVSVRAVAARAGIGPSTLRHYFPTQSDLHHALVGRSFHAQLSDLHIADRERDAVERLTECLAQFLPADDAAVRQLEGWLSLYASALGAARAPQGQQLLQSLLQHAYDRVNGWLKVLHEEGVLRPAPQGRHARTLLAVVDGLCLDLLMAAKATSVAEARAILSDVVTRTILNAQHNPTHR